MRILVALLLVSSMLPACAAEPLVKKPKGPLGSSADNPVRVEKMSDEVDYLQSHPCGEGGHWRMGEQAVLPTPEEPSASGCVLDKFAVTCSTTGERSAFFFLQCL